MRDFGLVINFVAIGAWRGEDEHHALIDKKIGEVQARVVPLDVDAVRAALTSLNEHPASHRARDAPTSH